MNAPDALVEAAFRAMLTAKTSLDRRIAGSQFTKAVRARIAERTSKEIERLERARGLR